ncbi:hypothetical protein [Pseudarthrobacter sp. NPDC058119]|uniref:hypothetical protein n=1 Tax=Pseudarthrobacter sp. NPDC058119 TaxID=3346348 RepID=UPI0036D78CBA
MKGNRSRDMFSEDWEPRIGRVAANTLKSAAQYLRYFFILWPIVIAILFAAMLTRTMPDWLATLMLSTVALWFVVAFWSFGTFSIRRKRAGRQAWEYLGRPPQLRQRRVLRFALRDPEVFDNYLAEKGIPPKGNYASLASPKAIAKGERTHTSS